MNISEIEGRYVSIHGVRSYYERCGKGVPVLLLHSAGREGRQWHGIMEQLGDRFQFFAPDLPGHGKSWPLAGNTCLSDAVEISKWLVDFMTRVAGPSFAVMGCSLGGKLSLLMGGLYPQIRAVVALQGSDFQPGQSGFNDASIDVMVHPHNNLMFAQMEFTLSLLGEDATEAGRAFSEWGVLTINPLAQQGDLRAYTRCDTTSVVRDIRCPVLLVHGSRDWLVSREMVEATAKKITQSPRVEVLPLPGLGHFPHVENPKRLAAPVGKFLEEVLR